jgi:hypothetical protein
MEESSIHCTDLRRKYPSILIKELIGVLNTTRTIAGYQNSKLDFTSSTLVRA